MKLSPSTIAANLSAAAAAEAETATATTTQSSNSTSSITAVATSIPASTQSSSNMPPNHPAGGGGVGQPNQNHQMNRGAGGDRGGSNSNTTNNNAPSTTANSAINSGISSNTMAECTPATAKISPKDSQVVAAILKEMGITEYEPRVLPQLVEFAYRYVSRVLEDAQLFSSYGQKKVIDTDDASLAIQMQIDRSFVGPPSRDILLEIARNKNTQPLPPIKSHNGMRLPADRYSMVAPNFRLVSNNKNKIQTGTIPSGTNPVRSVTSLLVGGNNTTSSSSSSFINSKITLANSSNISGKNITSSNDVFGAKRKLDDA